MDVKEQERHYRRGLILGLTLAEVMLLVLFCLLLVLLHSYSKNKPLTAVQREAVRLADSVVVVDQGSSENDFKDLFTSLSILVRKGNTNAIKALTDALAKLPRDDPQAGVDRRNSPDLSSKVESEKSDKQRAAEAIAAVTALTETIAKTRNVDAVQQAGQIIREVDAAKTSLGERSALTLVQKTIEREKQLQADAAKALKPGGPGTEHPSCWISPETGKPEYIFDVTLTSGFVSVHDNALPHRSAEQAALPLRGIVFEQDVLLANFMTMTLLLYEWSDAHDCRFFVRIIDKTEGHEKAIYKRELRVVGERFYHFEDLVLGQQ